MRLAGSHSHAAIALGVQTSNRNCVAKEVKAIVCSSIVLKASSDFSTCIEA